MAEQALGPGGTVARRRAFFGLLDANGWGWAGVKAAVWFVLIIMLMAYLPDRALYATVQNTIDLGVSLKVFNPALDLTPISFCPASNRTVPCPAPAGTVLPWEPSPAELLLPAPRADAAIVGSRPPDAPGRRHGREDGPGQRLRDGHPAGRQPRRVEPGRGAAGAAGPGIGGLLLRRRLRHRRDRRERRADRHGLRGHARRGDRQDLGLDRIDRT